MLLPLSAPAETAEQPAPDVRVLLRRLNLTDRADLRLSGAYLASWDGSRMLIPSGSEITVQLRDQRLILFYRDAALDCGTHLTLTREIAVRQPDQAGFTVSGSDGLYPGDLRLTISGGQLQPVLTVNVEDYLLGVLPYEMSESFPLEALKAQAVCARTYALSRISSGKSYDLTDDTTDQVYRPARSSQGRVAQAVRETAGLVGFSGNKLAICYYSASNGGQTELPSHVWGGSGYPDCYAVAEDPWDVENPESVQKTAFLRRDGTRLPEDFEALLEEIIRARPEMKDFVPDEGTFRVDEIQSVAMSSPRYGKGCLLMTKMEIRLAVSGKQELPADTPEPPLTWEADEEDVTPTPQPTSTPAPERRLSEFRPAGTFTLTLDLFSRVIRALGLSVYGADNEIVTVEETEDGFRLISRRFGHGVGLSQRGAQWMAGRYGKTFLEILAFYYPGMELRKAAAGAPALPTADPVLAETPGPAATPTPRPTLMPVTTGSLPEGAWIASVEGIEDDSSLNLRAEPSGAGEILMRLYKHQQLIVLESCEDPTWVHVRTDSAEGYVMVSFLEKTDSP